MEVAIKTRWMMFLRGVAAVVMVWMFAGPAFGQTTTGSIYGTVTDNTGALIAKAQVKAVSVQTGVAHTTTSNNSGDYVFPALDPGDYVISSSSTGFGTETERGIHLDANQNAHVTFALVPGSVEQAVEVTAATTLVDTRESQLGETVDQRRIEDLPLNGRQPYDLVQIIPGVTNYSASAANGDADGTKFSVNGNRTNQDSFYLDGAGDTGLFSTGGEILPNPDALQEFRLLTSNFDAEYGRSPGGVVSAITRGGTNAFHGLAYDYLRNNILNAKNYFNTTVTPLKQNQFGGTFGGPIKKDKAFFFLSYQGLRIVTPQILSAGAIVTPTPAEAIGNFSQFLPTTSGAITACNQTLSAADKAAKDFIVCSPITKKPYAGNIITDPLDPVAVNALKTVPLEDPTTLISPQQQASANVSSDQGMGRADYQLSASHKLSATFFTSHGTSHTPNASSNQIYDYSGQVSYANQTNIILSDAWTVSANKLNSFRAFYTFNHFNANHIYSTNTLQDLGSQAAIGSPPSTQPYFSITGYWNMGMTASGVGNKEQSMIGGADTFNWSLGNHQVKLGGTFIWDQYSEHGPYFGSGTVTFSGATTGNALADFELGKANSFRQNNGSNHNLHDIEPSLFAQDDWRVTHKLTLDLGVRYEVFTPFFGQNNFGTFVPYVQSTRFPTAPLGLLSSGDAGVPDGVIHTDWKAFAPRVGFAYDVFGNGKTGLRAGYGFFYATKSVNQATNLEQQPYILDITINATPNLVNPYAPAADPFPYAAGSANPVFQSGASLDSVPPGASFPYVQEYNLTLEQQLSANWGFRLAYVGNTGRKFYVSRDQNAPVYAPGASITTAGLNARRPYQPTPSTYVFGEIAENDPLGNSSYNALQLTVTKKFAQGFSFLGSYVWSKLIDINASDPSNTTLILENESNAGMDRAVSSLDVPHRFVASILYSTPEVHHFGFVGKQVLSGWQLNAITTLSHGQPVNVVSGVDSNLDGTSTTDRPNEIGNPVIYGGRPRTAKIKQYFNTAAYAPVAAGVPYGTASRNSVFGPNYMNTDFSGFKRFPVKNYGQLEFRAELFNLFNYVNLSNPTATYTSSKFGQITGAGAARVVQGALRYSF